MMNALIKQTTEYLSFGKGDQLTETVNKVREQILDWDQQEDWSRQTRHSSNQRQGMTAKVWILFWERGILLSQKEWTDLELKEFRGSSDVQHKKTKHLPTLSEKKYSEKAFWEWL